jgi:lipoate-protein ligase A
MPGTIKYLDLTLPSPAENLALDEALLDVCEAGGDEVLRFWESPQLFVVAGLGRTVTEDVWTEVCAAEQILILRRCSGGGTIVQGPGCLSYALILRQESQAELQSLSGANRFIMERNRAALANLTGLDVRVEGHTDLAANNRKFSGNAQRRRRRSLLFHGTFLLDFDVSRVERLLQIPSLQPAYRRARLHREFLRSLDASPAQLKTVLKNAWEANEPLGTLPGERVQSLVRDKYSRKEWNWRK